MVGLARGILRVGIMSAPGSRNEDAVRTATLLFFAVVSLFLGALASLVVGGLQAAGLVMGADLPLPFSVYAAVINILSLAAPAGFVLAAVVTASRRQ